ncbi:MAG: hydroxymethylbilane synthase [Acidimicrobiales bacterium]
MSSVARPFRLATRGSPLARWQADRVVALLAAVGVAAEPMIVDTEGDRRTDVPLAQIGGQGVFVKEVQAAVARGDADAAVHSAKDLPASEALSIPGMVIGAFPERGDPRDVLVGGRLEGLPTGALVATGSARRRVQLANLRPDLTFTDLRGNLATRLAKVGADGVIAVVAARAALDRLDWDPPPGMAVETLEPEVMLPQVAQGALAVECRAEDDVTRTILAAIDDDSVRYLVEAERAFLAELGGGCTLPVGAHAVPVSAVDANGGNSRIRLTGMVAGADGLVVLRHEMVGTDGLALGRAVARYLIDDAGGAELMSWSPAP